jgi:hypothetical protein
MEGRSRGGDGRAEKRYLKQITALQPEWLAQLACADGGGVATTPLCRLSAPLPEPAPHYAKDLDAVVCYVRPSFGFGGTAWPLPPHPCVMNAATAGGREPGTATEYAIFGRALLEGNVLDGMAPLQKFWVGQPALMVRPNGEQDTKVRELVSALRKAKVSRKVELIKQLKEDPRFLLPALQRCAYARSLSFCLARSSFAVGSHTACIVVAVLRWTVAAKRGLMDEVWRVVVAKHAPPQKAVRGSLAGAAFVAA